MTKPPLTNPIAEISVVALAGIALGLLGPFGTEALPLGDRFLYWVVGMLVSWLTFRGIVVVMRELTRLLGIPEIFAYVLAIPALGAAIMIAQSWFGNRIEPANLSVAVYIQILGLGLAFFVLFWLIYYRASRNEPQNTGAEATSEQSRVEESILTNTGLHDQLPTGFGSIIALSVEDHYVRVHSVEQSEMLLMKLSEAIALVGADNGLQVHRSWWVATSSVTGEVRSGRNRNLQLIGGLIAPVSRRNVAKARAAGLLD